MIGPSEKNGLTILGYVEMIGGSDIERPLI